MNNLIIYFEILIFPIKFKFMGDFPKFHLNYGNVP